MYKLNLIFTLIISLLLFSCNKDDDTLISVSADFKTNVLLGENQAIVTVKNLSQNATSYQWSASSGTIDNATDENTSIAFTENGTYSITLVASNGTISDSKTIKITIDNIPDNGHIPYRYLENDGIFMYYKTENIEVYQSLIPEEFEMPSRMVVFAFINDFYELDYGATPYKENAISILVEYQGEEFFHCVYMPVTDEHSMWAGIIGLGLPKTMGEINFYRDSPRYYGNGTNPLGGRMDMNVDTQNFTVENDAKQEMIDLSLLRSLQIRNGNIIEIGKTGGNENSIIEIAEQFPNLVTLKFGEATITTNTDEISFNHPLDLTPTTIIGGYYLKNKIPFGLTGNPYQKSL